MKSTQRSPFASVRYADPSRTSSVCLDDKFVVGSNVEQRRRLLPTFRCTAVVLDLVSGRLLRGLPERYPGVEGGVRGECTTSQHDEQTGGSVVAQDEQAGEIVSGGLYLHLEYKVIDLHVRFLFSVSCRRCVKAAVNNVALMS